MKFQEFARVEILKKRMKFLFHGELISYFQSDYYIEQKKNQIDNFKYSLAFFIQKQSGMMFDNAIFFKYFLIF